MERQRASWNEKLCKSGRNATLVDKRKIQGKRITHGQPV